MFCLMVAYISLKGPFGLAVGLAEPAGEDNFLVLALLDMLVLERNDPLLDFLQGESNAGHFTMCLSQK